MNEVNAPAGGNPDLLPKSETPTIPKMSAMATKDTREQIEGLYKLPGNREISSQICSIDRLKDPLLLKCRRVTRREGVIVFAEFHSTENGVTYVYCAKDYENPDYTQSDKSFAPVDSPGATVLLRVEENGAPTEIHRWKD